MKKALVCGISGQDGSYLARFLLEKGYEVFGTSRDAHLNSFTGLRTLGIFDRVRLLSTTLTDFRSIIQAINVAKPDEIYNLAGQSSVGLSFEQPVETLESIALGSLNLLEAVRFLGGAIRLYNAASSECFGDTHGKRATEKTPFYPRSPYGVAKCTSFWEVANYREAYGLYACSGILFNHESPMRPERFVTAKIISSACRIAAGSTQKLSLGNLNISRDWGWAPEYVEAMWLMLQQERAEDFVIATGETNSLADFADVAFGSLGLNWRDHVVSDSSLFRPSDIESGMADASKAAKVMGWKATSHMREVVAKLISARQSALG
ncbi:GDP-mannose 4,6-dehydratase [soil metagenome]